MLDPGRVMSQVIRPCEGCTLCCKLVAVAALGKPAGEWCAHCDTKRGCTAHEARPADCRSFQCRWTLDPSCGPEWKPSVSKLVVSYDRRANAVVMMVDPGAPGAWRREPFFSWLKQTAAAALTQNGLVLVLLGGRTTVITPDDEVDVGVLAAEDRIVVTRPGARYLVAVERAGA